MKKMVSTMIAGVITLACGACSPLGLFLLAPASGMPMMTRNSATSGPSAPATISAPRPPIHATSAATIAGATAPPTKPAKVWIENARPIRASSICADRIA